MPWGSIWNIFKTSSVVGLVGLMYPYWTIGSTSMEFRVSADCKFDSVTGPPFLGTLLYNSHLIHKWCRILTLFSLCFPQIDGHSPGVASGISGSAKELVKQTQAIFKIDVLITPIQSR